MQRTGLFLIRQISTEELMQYNAYVDDWQNEVSGSLTKKGRKNKQNQKSKVASMESVLSLVHYLLLFTKA